jgi:CubicO group peptidase (beta-lactamase class C family)
MMRRKPVSGIAAAAGLHSNIEDMARWLGVLIRGCTSLSSDTGVLSPATIQRMCAPHIAIAQPNALLMRGLEWLGNDATYGLGMFLGRSLGRQFAFHMAIIDGFTSVMAFSPVDQLGVVVLSNTNCSPVPGLLAQQLRTDSPVSASPGTASGGDARPALQPSRSVDIQVGGSYTSDAYGVIELQDAGEEKALLYGTERWPLELRGPGSASLTVPVLGMAIELPVEFEMAGGVPRALTIPLALDPRVAPECFRRC